MRKDGDMKDNLVTCLWFDTEGEEAARFYTTVFRGSKLGKITRYGSAGPREEGTVMTVAFEVMGQEFIALNGGPQFTFSEAISFQVLCESQEEVDRYWETLSDGGEQGPCGWLKDRFGVSWQVVPTALPRLLEQADPERSQRVMEAMMGMRKLVIDELERAAVA
jgi:predicted 3-demethylubiquinone-9 3-methyltransferase (glyoxalase superfamily)